jgi:hypothetical protein
MHKATAGFDRPTDQVQSKCGGGEIGESSSSNISNRKPSGRKNARSN